MTQAMRRCMNAKVKAGILTRDLADQAERYIDDLERQYAQEMSPDMASASAASEVARIMAEETSAAKTRAALQALAAARAVDRMEAHPNGPSAGALAVLSRDIRDADPGPNVDTRKASILGIANAKWEAALTAYRSKAAGLTQDIIGPRKMVEEMFGGATGDATASRAAGGFKSATDYLADRFQAAGGRLAQREDWRLPQHHDRARILDAAMIDEAGTRSGISYALLPTPAAKEARRAASKLAWTQHMEAELMAGNLKIKDRETGTDVSTEKAFRIIDEAFDNIVTDGLSSLEPGKAQGKSVANRYSDSRVFDWQNADAWLTYNDRFGAGKGGLFTVFSQHLDRLARDVALIEILGPNPNTTVRYMTDVARKAEGLKARGIGDALSPVRAFESPAAIQRTYDAVSGKLNEVDSSIMASGFSAVRDWQSAAKLGSAILSSATDIETLRRAATWNGLPAAKTLATTLKMMNPANEADRAIATRIGLVSEAVSNRSLGIARHGGEFSDGLMGRFASFVIRAQGLQAWTDGAKLGFSMEFSGFIAEQAGKAFRDLPDPLLRSFKRYGISEADWNVIRAAPTVDHDGARFMSPVAVAGQGGGQGPADRVLEMILQERAFAMIEPDARVKGTLSGGLQRGTFWGEMARSTMMFKSFPVTLQLTHTMRGAMRDGTVLQKGGRAVAMMTTLTALGALSVQMKQIAAGKDPRDMTGPEFWGSAFLQGGGLGIFGDLINSAVTRSGQGFTDALVGPVVGLGAETVKLVSGNARKLIEGEDTSFGAQLSRFARFNLPGGNLWYSRLAVDRLWMDQLQEMIDPDYRQSFRHLENKARQDFGQQFYWRPGEAAPDRGPDLGAALGR